jgi:hypothetical protein
MHLAYKHDIGIEIVRDSLRAHFVVVRDRCVNEIALHCVLLSASIDDNDNERDGGYGAGQRATLRLRLPHDLIVPFANSLTKPLPGEPPAVARVRRQSTSAEDLGQPIADVERRLAQLTNYRDRLQTLAARPDIHVDDLIKIAGEMSHVQTELEAANAEQRELAQRVETEELDIGFLEPAGQGLFDAVSTTWARSADTFGRSTASAIDFAISAIPWLPLVALLLVAARAGRRFVFGGARTKTARSGAP